MKVMVAVDGSPCSNIAVDLVANLEWPAGSSMRVVSALDTVRLAGPWAGLAPTDLTDVESDLADDLKAMLEGVAGRLAATGCTMDTRAVLGRAPDAILDQALEMAPDLIVVGSRGFGPMRTLLLGSVSSEVVDHAPCPVLVVRKRIVSRILLAHDGSAQARAAEDVLAAWPIFDRPPLEVLSVARVHPQMPDPIAPGAQEGSLEAYRQAIGDTRQRYEEITHSAAERLERSGWQTAWDVRAGDPANIIVTEAEAHSIDLVVMGTHGRTGFNRMVLGSVAHKVLTHAHCSVLVVRGRVPAHVANDLPGRVAAGS